MIVMAAGLSFWGLCAQPPQAEWGVMLSEFAKTGTAFLGALRLFLSITVLFS